MGFHTFPLDRADALEDPSRYRFCSREELLSYLDVSAEDLVADLGSGTGFYTDDVAPFADTVYAVDVQEGMHDYYREKGVPENVDLVTAAVEDLPFETDGIDVAFSTMTYHEFAGDDAMREISRVLGADGRFVVVDWSANGDGDSGPPREERFDLPTARGQLRDAGYVVEHAEFRAETFVLVGRR